MWRGCEEFDANALTFVRGIPDENDAGLLLFLSKWIGDNDDSIRVDRLIQIEQTTMGVNHDGFAGFAEASVVGIFSGHNDANSHEDAGAAASVVQVTLSHDASMLRQTQRTVNIRVHRMFPPYNVARALACGGSCMKGVKLLEFCILCIYQTPQAEARATFADVCTCITRYDFARRD